MVALGLLDHESESSTIAYASLIQTFNRFLLETMTAESIPSTKPWPSLLSSSFLANSVTPAQELGAKPPLAQLVRLEARTINLCGLCACASYRENPLSYVDLIYPRKVGFSIAFRSDLLFGMCMTLTSLLYQKSDRHSRMNCRQHQIFAPFSEIRFIEKQSLEWSVKVVVKLRI